MSDTLQSRKPPVQARALRAAGIAIALAAGVRAPFRSIAEQVVRAAASVPADIAEGEGRSGRGRLHHWRIAYGSAKELEMHLELLVHTGAVDRAQAAEALLVLDQVRAMLWRMLHPR